MTLRRFAVFAAPCALVLAGLVLPASAQNYRGKFTLPFQAHWGAVDLQPGEYTIATATVGSTPVIYLTGNGGMASVLPGTVMIREASDRGGQLEVTDVNGTPVITRFVAASVGREYSFPISKSVARNGFGAVALKKAVVPISN